MTIIRRLSALRRQQPRLALVAGLTGLLFLGYPFVDVWLRSLEIAPQFNFWDFGAYGAAVNRWEAGEAVYVRNDSGGFHGKFLYPPFTLLLFWPFTLLDYPWGARLWGVVSVLVLWVGMVGLIRRLGVDLRFPERLLVLWGVLGFQPLLLTLKMGQMAGFLTGMLCLAYAVLPAGEGISRSRAVLSGALTGVVGVAKLPYATASAHLLTDRNRVLGGVAGVAGLLALSLVVFGVDTHVAYLDVLRWGIDAGSRARHPSLWLAPYYRPFYVVAGVSFPLQVLLSLGVAGLAVFSRAEANSEVFALGLAAVPLISPKTYAYYLVVLLPAATILLVREYQRGGYPIVALVGLVLANVHSYGLKLLVDLGPSLGGLKEAWATVLPLLQPGLWANVLLVGFAAWRVSQHVALPDSLANGRDRAASKGD